MSNLIVFSQLEWKTQTVKIPTVIQVQETVYEVKMIPIQVCLHFSLLAITRIIHRLGDVSYIYTYALKMQVPRAIIETVTVEVPYRDIRVPVRQVMFSFDFTTPSEQ